MNVKFGWLDLSWLWVKSQMMQQEQSDWGSSLAGEIYACE